MLEKKLLFDLHKVMFLSGNRVSLGGDHGLSVEPAQRLELEEATPQPLIINHKCVSICCATVQGCYAKGTWDLCFACLPKSRSLQTNFLLDSGAGHHCTSIRDLRR